MLKVILAAIALSLALAGGAMAQTCSAYPFTLTNGTTADASAVMANFTTIATCANGLPTLGANQVWTASQRVTLQTVVASVSTFTPNLDTGADFSLALSSSCPCTLANPSTTPVAGQHGVIYVTQDGTGSRTIGTWGSLYYASGGTSTIILSTAANAIDVLSYTVKDATHIIVTPAAFNVSH